MHTEQKPRAVVPIVGLLRDAGCAFQDAADYVDGASFRERLQVLSDQVYDSAEVVRGLLEALRRCLGSLRTVSPGGDGDPDVVFARAAIAAATGEPK